MAGAAPTGALAHGGRLGEARRQFPGAPEPFIDLSTGINPIAYPLPELGAAVWQRLPEPETLADLQAAAARAYGVHDPALVVAAPGTQILISLLPNLLRHRAATVLGPTYGEHAASWRNAGSAVREVTAWEKLGQDGAVVVCNPNNPDGRRWPPASLIALADRLARHGGVLIVDEAFADFDPGLSLAPALPHPALIILRSFGKAYGLAGLRLGFALSAAATAERLRLALGPWAVSGPAATAGIVALADAEWRRLAAGRLAADTARLDGLLRSAGLDVQGGTLLFRLARSETAPSWFARLGRAGILVRRFDADPALLRFGLPANQPAWDRLEKALRT
ncbi:MAG: threonine-phosphate decarboxylase CobD [Acetobacteraceae bacterium]|nr:threonine-phosphate decarboxylase CobD [Acetobacteraceae bacterium]